MHRARSLRDQSLVVLVDVGLVVAVASLDRRGSRLLPERRPRLLFHADVRLGVVGERGLGAVVGVGGAVGAHVATSVRRRDRHSGRESLAWRRRLLLDAPSRADAAQRGEAGVVAEGLDGRSTGLGRGIHFVWCRSGWWVRMCGRRRGRGRREGVVGGYVRARRRVQVARGAAWERAGGVRWCGSSGLGGGGGARGGGMLIRNAGS